MANQMIALQARAPQADLLGGAIRNNAALINNIMQQRAMERQNALAEQELRFKKAQEQRLAQQETRAASKAEIEEAAARFAFHRDQAVQVRSPEGYVNWLNGVAEDSPDVARAFALNLPPEKFTPEALTFMIGTAEQAFNARYPKAVASTQVSPEGGLMTSVASGIPGASYAVPQPDISQPITPAAPAVLAPAPAAPTTKLSPPPANGPSAAFRQNFSDFVSAPPEAIDAAAAAILKGTPINDPVLRDLSPKDFQEAQRRASRLVLDKTAFSPGGEDMGVAAVQPLTVENAPQIIQTAIQNGVIDQSHVEQLRQMVGPENDAALAQWMRQNNVRIQPAGEPSLRSAVYRPQQSDAAMLEQVQYDPSAYRQAQAKSPMQSPMPGSAIVPLPRVRGQAAAEEGGKQGVRVATEPVIVGASEEAKNLAELKKNLPKARGALDLAVKQLDRDLADVDYVLRNPARQMVVGTIEGRLPSFVNMFRPGGQDAQNVQSRLDKINAKSVVTHLQAMREASPQGSSLFGQVTEYEDRLVKALAGLDQAQDEPTFDRALQEYRGVIADMRQNLPRVFNDTYKAVGGSASVRPLPAGGKAGPTMDDIAYLRRNITKKGVAEGFMRTFGQQAFNEAVGRR